MDRRKPGVPARRLRRKGPGVAESDATPARGCGGGGLGLGAPNDRHLVAAGVTGGTPSLRPDQGLKIGSSMGLGLPEVQRVPDEHEQLLTHPEFVYVHRRH